MHDYTNRKHIRPYFSPDYCEKKCKYFVHGFKSLNKAKKPRIILVTKYETTKAISGVVNTSVMSQVWQTLQTEKQSTS